MQGTEETEEKTEGKILTKTEVVSVTESMKTTEKTAGTEETDETTHMTADLATTEAHIPVQTLRNEIRQMSEMEGPDTHNAMPAYLKLSQMFNY